VTDETRLEACEKEVQKLKIQVAVLIDALKSEDVLPILGPERFETFAKVLKQAWAEADL
jgi:hypothetical protein